MKEIENALAAAQVLSFRLPMLWAMALSPSPARRSEAVRMIVEKQMAMMEGMNAAALAALATWIKLAAGAKRVGRGCIARGDARCPAAGPAARQGQCAAIEAAQANLIVSSRNAFFTIR